MLGKIMAVVWAEAGVKIEKMKEQNNNTVVYISVPETSYRKDVNGEELSGMRLAKRFTEMLRDTGMDSAVVKSRIRSGECWSDEMGRDAGLSMRKTVYGF